MDTFDVRPATRPEIKRIAEWVLEERSRDPHFAREVNKRWRRPLYRRFFLPRYLASRAHTWVIRQGEEISAYAVVGQQGPSVHVADLRVLPGHDSSSLTTALLAHAESLARDGNYAFVRTSPYGAGQEDLAPYREAGYQTLDYYLWAYRGVVAGVEAPDNLVVQPVALNKALERRLHYLRRELDHSAVAGRDLIDADYLPNRPPGHRAFEIELEGQGIGFLIARPDERGDGVLTLVLSMQPVFWGSPLEARIAGGFASASGRGQGVDLRLLFSTTAHCEAADKALGAIGLERQLDVRPVLFKAIERPDAP